MYPLSSIALSQPSPRTPNAYEACPGGTQGHRLGTPCSNPAGVRVLLTGRSTLTSVPSSRDTRQVMIDFASPAAGMCVMACWASRRRVFSACFRIERRPSVRRRKLSMVTKRKRRRSRRRRAYQYLGGTKEGSVM